MPLKYDDESGSWASMSEGWPSTKKHAYSKYIFLNKSNLLEYGSWVLISDNELRVETKKKLKLLNENYDVVRKYILEDK